MKRKKKEILKSFAWQYEFKSFHRFQNAAHFSDAAIHRYQPPYFIGQTSAYNMAVGDVTQPHTCTQTQFHFNRSSLLPPFRNRAESKQKVLHITSSGSSSSSSISVEKNRCEKKFFLFMWAVKYKEIFIDGYNIRIGKRLATGYPKLIFHLSFFCCLFLLIPKREFVVTSTLYKSSSIYLFIY